MKKKETDKTKEWAKKKSKPVKSIGTGAAEKARKKLEGRGKTIEDQLKAYGA